MGFDVKYRPQTYEDVLGQAGTKRILRNLVDSGQGRHQSYVFAGEHGRGKTTLARILVRALLCAQPVEGEACDQCASCKAVLEGSCMDYQEIDAATQSGKAEVRRIVEDLDYLSLSGRRSIYIFDEAHQLSRSALDALLIPMEEETDGTGDKRLVCVFCTTEPEKMRDTVPSRVGITFLVKPVPTEKIVDRLEHVCEVENQKRWREKKRPFPYERAALRMLVEATGHHIRPALKSLESLSSLAEGVTEDNVYSYLQLDVNDTCLEVLSLIGQDEKACLSKVRDLLNKTSPVSAYEKLAQASLIAYGEHLGKPPSNSCWNKDAVHDLSTRKADKLLGYAQTFSARLGKPTPSMLVCDVLALSRYGIIPASAGVNSLAMMQSLQQESPPTPEPEEEDMPERPEPGGVIETRMNGCTATGKYIAPEARNKRVGGVVPTSPSTVQKKKGSALPATVAGKVLEALYQNRSAEDASSE